MTATTASDLSTPITYSFNFYASPTGGSGGSDSGWQSSTSYTNSDLSANHQYGYRVQARDSVNLTTSYSSVVYTYTLANNPGTDSFSDVTENSIQANWTTNGSQSGTEYYCENTTAGSNSGWTTNTYWNSTGLACGTPYSFRVKARNGDGVETDWTSLGSQETLACPLPGELEVTPPEGLISTGYQGGPFNPSSKTYTLENTGETLIDWGASKGEDWASLSSTGGTLSAGESTTVDVSINSNANSLTPASYEDTVNFTNTTNGSGDQTRSVSLTVTPPPGELEVTSSEGLTSSGYEGGPFTPLSLVYTLENTGGSSITWSASNVESWVTLEPTGGILTSGESTTMEVSINSNANSLAPGNYDDTISITNTTNGIGDTARPVSLTVNDLDSDDDGINDEEENAGPNSGDCNEDSISDSEQENVACFKTYNAQSYITIESVSGTSLQACQAVANPDPEDSPSWVDFQYGFFQFTITGVNPGEATTLTIRLPQDASPNAYYKYGPIPNDLTEQWYKFNYEVSAEIGAKFNNNVITLHFIDGQMGDDDLSENGIIQDDGGPGTISNGSISDTSDGPTGPGKSGDSITGPLGGCFIATGVY